MSTLNKIKTYSALGIHNVARVGLYRIGLKTGMHPVLKIKYTLPTQVTFFSKPTDTISDKAVARTDWQKGSMTVFGKKISAQKEPPIWSSNFNDTKLSADRKKPWWEIADFNETAGDIKCIWETSRFDWLIPMAQRAALGDSEELSRLNLWLSDWCENNESYLGSNWKCGQESSIRVLQMMLAAHILGQINNPSDAILQFIEIHLERIAPTISYAIGQSNNHGTSEAAALFVGGHFLALNKENKKANQWHSLGRRWLNDRAIKLIEKDGTFSQYSVNYHRMMLDTYSFVEFWRQTHQLPKFNTECLNRLKAGAHWLSQMTNFKTGATPLFGANDGAYILALTDSDYRDYRPSLQLAFALFENKTAIKTPGKWDQHLHWLDIKKPSVIIPERNSKTLDDGGLHILRKGNAVAYLRYPRFKFRPSQSDLLHCDFWVNEINILRDAGTYSYNADEKTMRYFNGVEGHNTVQFDSLDQMPKISRFLYGDWIKSNEVKTVRNIDHNIIASAAYKNKLEHCHHREIKLTENTLVVEDNISGNFKKAKLRWRLAPLTWKLKGNSITSNDFSLEFHSNDFIINPELIEGFESQYYNHKSTIPVVEIPLKKPCTITTVINF